MNTKPAAQIIEPERSRRMQPCVKNGKGVCQDEARQTEWTFGLSRMNPVALASMRHRHGALFLDKADAADFLFAKKKDGKANPGGEADQHDRRT